MEACDWSGVLVFPAPEMSGVVTIQGWGSTPTECSLQQSRRSEGQLQIQGLTGEPSVVHRGQQRSVCNCAVLSECEGGVAPTASSEWSEIPGRQLQRKRSEHCDLSLRVSGYFQGCALP